MINLNPASPIPKENLIGLTVDQAQTILTLAGWECRIVGNDTKRVSYELNFNRINIAVENNFVIDFWTG